MQEPEMDTVHVNHTLGVSSDAKQNVYYLTTLSLTSPLMKV